MSKKAVDHNIEVLEKRIARDLAELAKLSGHTTETITEEAMNTSTESVKTEVPKAEVEKKTLRAPAVGWLSAAWAAIRAFAGKTWENMSSTFDNVVLNPVVHQVAFGAAFLYGIAESIWLLAGNFSLVALAALPFEVVVSTIVLGASAVGLAFLSMFAVTSLKDVTVGAWNKTASAASTAWNWVATPFRKAETTKVEAPKTEAPKVEPMKSEEDGFDSKRAAARETTKLVPDTSNAALAAIGV